MVADGEIGDVLHAASGAHPRLGYGGGDAGRDHGVGMPAGESGDDFCHGRGLGVERGHAKRRDSWARGDLRERGFSRRREIARRFNRRAREDRAPVVYRNGKGGVVQQL